MALFCSKPSNGFPSFCLLGLKWCAPLQHSKYNLSTWHSYNSFSGLCGSLNMMSTPTLEICCIWKSTAQSAGLFTSFTLFTSIVYSNIPLSSFHLSNLSQTQLPLYFPSLRFAQDLEQNPLPSEPSKIFAELLYYW